jgi:hypothetical protein
MQEMYTYRLHQTWIHISSSVTLDLFLYHCPVMVLWEWNEYSTVIYWLIINLFVVATADQTIYVLDMFSLAWEFHLRIYENQSLYAIFDLLQCSSSVSDFVRLYLYERMYVIELCVSGDNFKYISFVYPLNSYNIYSYRITLSFISISLLFSRAHTFHFL